MRGVSPVIAVVILIFVTVVIGVMLSGWVFKEVSEQTRTSPDCSVNTKYTIESAKFKSSANETGVIVINDGAEPLYGFSLQIENGTHIETITGLVESPATSSANKLGKGRSVSLTYTCMGSANRTLGLTATRLKVITSACPEVFKETKIIEQIR